MRTVGCLTRRSLTLTALVACVAIFASPRSTYAGLAGVERIASSLPLPTYAAQPAGDANRMFVATKGGQIRIVDLTTNTTLPTPFLTIADTDASSGESGLLGLAFHPDFAANGKFYVNVTVNNGSDPGPFDTRIREYTVSSTDPNLADPSSAREILRFSQPQGNHNAGWIGFSPVDGYLYIPTGDGGNGYDSGTGHTATIGNGQDLTNNLLGKLLRIDVDADDFPADATRNYGIPADNPYVGAAGDDEIYDYGLRNPFRAEFDRATGDLWIGDVGQDWFEEVNLHPADAPGGINFGWVEMEGRGPTMNFNGVVVGSTIPGARLPEYDYLQRDKGAPALLGGESVIAGFVYRGPDPTLRGQYIFGDARSGYYWMFDPADPENTVTNIDSLLTTGRLSPGVPYGFGQDGVGNLYIVSPDGGLYRILTDELTPGDFDANGMVDGADLVDWQAGYGVLDTAATSDGDANDDGDVTGLDYLLWQQNFGDSSLNVPATPAGARVPEPPTYALLLIAAACLYACLRQIVGGRSPRMQR
ncbi:MAG: sugar dehydrogenase [Planctomycetaceae bacterium]|nr:sugar dehydrogenase [Planctomycetaceae bacterium]